MKHIDPTRDVNLLCMTILGIFGTLPLLVIKRNSKSNKSSNGANTNNNRATASSKKGIVPEAQIFVQEGIPTAEEFVICNKELNLMAKISFRYGKHAEPFTGESLMLLLGF